MISFLNNLKKVVLKNKFSFFLTIIKLYNINIIMNIGLIGSGGREHALCKKIYESNLTNQIICFPGNAGTAEIAINIDVNILDFKKILNFIKLLRLTLF